MERDQYLEGVAAGARLTRETLAWAIRGGQGLGRPKSKPSAGARHVAQTFAGTLAPEAREQFLKECGL